jgi:hypothetical protein
MDDIFGSETIARRHSLTADRDGESADIVRAVGEETTVSYGFQIASDQSRPNELVSVATYTVPGTVMPVQEGFYTQDMIIRGIVAEEEKLAAALRANDGPARLSEREARNAMLTYVRMLESFLLCDGAQLLCIEQIVWEARS